MGELIRFPLYRREQDIDEARRKQLRDDYYAGRLTADEFYDQMHGDAGKKKVGAHETDA